MARHFSHMLRRQASLNHLFQTIRLALHDPQIHSALLHDWQRQDLPALVKAALQASLTFSASSGQPSAPGAALEGDTGGRKRRIVDQSFHQPTVDVILGCKSQFIDASKVYANDESAMPIIIIRRRCLIK